MKKIAILGSTGSIGTQALSVCAHLGYTVNALGANRNVALMQEQIRAFSPQYAVMMDAHAAKDLAVRVRDTNTKILSGIDGFCEIAALEENDLVLNSVVGMIGLRPTLAALEQGTTVALANKETLVAAGEIVCKKAKEKNALLLPVDSEHSAVFQCLQAGKKHEVQKIILTASGGPFFGMGRKQLESVTAKEALKHPNWSMGDKLTIDSATMMNKGLEVIEASWLFGTDVNDIEVLVHTQSVIHSMVQFRDGSLMAQLGVTDMRIPIQYALSFPERLGGQSEPLSLSAYQNLSFYEPDLENFPALALCYRAARMGGLYPCAVNAANEQAVALFLQGKIGFLQIAQLVEQTVFSRRLPLVYELQDVFALEREIKQKILEQTAFIN